MDIAPAFPAHGELLAPLQQLMDVETLPVKASERARLLICYWNWRKGSRWLLPCCP